MNGPFRVVAALVPGAGAETRRTLGTAVVAGMIGVTLFGIFLTPVFCSVVRWVAGGPDRPAPAQPPEEPVLDMLPADPRVDGEPSHHIRAGR